MKIVRLADSGAGRVLVEATSERPRPAHGEVLIRVHAAGVIPSELSWYPTSHKKSGEARTGAIPGHEFSGVIVEAGESSGSFKVNDEVFGMNDWFSEGATAEYCVTPYTSIALKPRNLSHAEAASVPISALTAQQGLFDRAKLQRGEHVLVHGGAGAVGIFAIQLAKLHGAGVTATASASDFGFLASLGVDQAIDYRASRFEETVGNLDVVFDTVGGATLDRSWKVLKPLGRMVTVATQPKSRLGMTAPRVHSLSSNRIKASSTKSPGCWTPGNCALLLPPLFHCQARRMHMPVKSRSAAPAKWSSRSLKRSRLAKLVFKKGNYAYKRNREIQDHPGSPGNRAHSTSAET